MIHACTEFLDEFLCVDPDLRMLTNFKIENPSLKSSLDDVGSLHVVMIEIIFRTITLDHESSSIH